MQSSYLGNLFIITLIQETGIWASVRTAEKVLALTLACEELTEVSIGFKEKEEVGRTPVSSISATENNKSHVNWGHDRLNRTK